MITVSIPITLVKAGMEYIIPVKLSDLPVNVTSVEIILESEESLFEMSSIETKVGMFEGKMFFFNNSPVVHDVSSNTINTEWLSPYSKTKAIAVMADARPVSAGGDDIAFCIKGIAKDNGNAIILCSYLCINANIEFGKKPLMIHLAAILTAATPAKTIPAVTAKKV